jgi:hypothetical protein
VSGNHPVKVIPASLGTTTALKTGIAFLPLVAVIMAGFRDRVAGGAPHRRPAAADCRQCEHGWRVVLAVPDQRAQQLRRRAARPDADHRGRPGTVVRADGALATGFSHGFLVSAGIGLLALIIAVAAICVTRQDLSGVDPMAAAVG